MSLNSKFGKHVPILIVPVLLLLGHVSLRADPVTMMSFVSPTGTNYLYDFAITNNSATDPYAELVSVDLSLPVGSVMGSAMAPAGNGATTDPSGDFVEFSSNNLTGFAVGTTVNGFQFLSSTRFTSFSFTANYFNSTESKLTPFTGTSSPQAPAVPEPATFGLLTGASLLLLGRVRTLRRA